MGLGFAVGVRVRVRVRNRVRVRIRVSQAMIRCMMVLRRIDASPADGCGNLYGVKPYAIKGLPYSNGIKYSQVHLN